MRGCLLSYLEGKRSWWVGRASNPVGGAMRRWVGSTPIPLRRLCMHWVTVRPHLRPALDAEKEYGIDARPNLRPLATPTQRKYLCRLNPSC